MCIRLDSKNSKYEISRRNFLDDYANHITKKIDMTLSGKYLYKYPRFNVDYLNFSNYPTRNSIESLIIEIKKHENIKDKEIIVGAGANGIIQNIVKLLFKEGNNLVTPFLTFNQPEYAVTSMGGFTKRVKMYENGEINCDNIIKSVDKNTKMIYICNPNNPTGILLDNEKIKYIANNVNTYVVIDESAIEFSNKSSLVSEKIPDNMIIIRSFSKAYGIANLRVGYMACSDRFKKVYNENVTINEISGISCEYARKVISSEKYKKNTKLIICERKKIEKELQNIGFEFYPSASNILLSKTLLTDDIYKRFNENNISAMFIKDEYGKIHFRIAVQEKKINKMFVKVCKKIL